MLRILLIVGAGGFLGSVARYLAAKYIQQTVLSPFPYGTFWVNILGCFLIGLFYGLSERSGVMSNELRLFLTVGFCGGFTTFSSFTNENFILIQNGQFLTAFVYILGSVLVGILSVYIGYLISNLL